MAQTQINGGTQIRTGTIPGSVLTSNAGILDTQLNSAYLYANGTRSLTGILNGGGFEAQNFATPTASGSLATKNYVDTMAQGLNQKYSVRAATTGAETYTITSGSVTQINGTTIDGQSVNVNEYVLVKDAPSASGTGSANSLQPANGIYIVTGNTTNLTVSRASDLTGSNSPAGAYVFVEAGSTYAASGWVVTTPSSNAAFTYGTGSIQWTQFTGAGEITVDSTLTKSGNSITRAAITGDVTIGTNSNAATIAAGVVTFAKMAALAANSLIGNPTGASATPTAVTMTALPTASTVMYRDGNGNVATNNYIRGLVTTATSGGTTTLTVSSAQFQQFTGTSAQTVVLPAATTLQVGQSYILANRSSASITVQTNGGATLTTLAAGGQATFHVVANGTAAGTWDASVSGTGGSGTVTTVSVVTANGFAGTVANASTTPAITLTTSVTGVLKGNGTAITAAATSDLIANYVVRETPGGTVNGSTTAFTLAYTPVAGTEMVFKSGVLQDPGGNDYTISTNTITFTTAPASGDTIRVTYWH